MSAPKCPACLIDCTSRSRQRDGRRYWACPGCSTFCFWADDVTNVMSDAGPLCTGHNVPSKSATTMKANENQGRRFWKCAATGHGTQCKFFEWRDKEWPPPSPSPSPSPWSSPSKATQHKSPAKIQGTCPKCGPSETRETTNVVSQANTNGNAGRSYATCGGCGKWLRWTSSEASLPMPTPSTAGSIEFQVPDATMRLLQTVCDVPPGTGLDDSGRCSGRLAASEPPDPDYMKLVCAWRVQNPVRTKKYLRFRERARAAVASAPIGWQPREVSLKPSFADATRTLIEESPDQLRPLDKSINEVLLLHGAKPEALFPMLFQGLDPEMARRSGLFGAGTYFAEDAAKVDQYATLDSKSRWKDADHPLYDLHNKLYSHGLKHPKDVHYALVCRVVLGSNPAFTKDGKTRIDLGKEHRSLFTDHTRKKIAGGEHALVAEFGVSVDRFREFVAFDPDAIDVEYLVAYKRERNYCDCEQPIVRRTVVANTENKDRPLQFCKFKGTENDCGFSRMLPLCYCDWGRHGPRFASVKSSKYGKFYGCGSKGAPECDFKQRMDGPSGDSGALEERRGISESPSKRQRTNQSLAFP